MVPSSYKTGFFVKNVTPWASLAQVSEDARTIFKRIRAKLMDLQQDPGVGLKFADVCHESVEFGESMGLKTNQNKALVLRICKTCKMYGYDSPLDMYVLFEQ